MIIHVFLSSSDRDTARLARPLIVSLYTTSQWPPASRTASSPDPGFGREVSPTGPHVLPRSLDSATRTVLNTPTPVTFVTIGDGLSNTLLFGEKHVLDGHWGEFQYVDSACKTVEVGDSSVYAGAKNGPASRGRDEGPDRPVRAGRVQRQLRQ